MIVAQAAVPRTLLANAPTLPSPPYHGPLRGATIGCADPLHGATIGCADIPSSPRPSEGEGREEVPQCLAASNNSIRRITDSIASGLTSTAPLNGNSTAATRNSTKPIEIT